MIDSKWYCYQFVHHRCPALPLSFITDNEHLLSIPVRVKSKPEVLHKNIVMTHIAASMCSSIVTAMLSSYVRASRCSDALFNPFAMFS